MALVHHLSPEEAKYERAKAERATFVVSEAVGDPQLMVRALESIEACDRGIAMLWPEFLRWESSRRGQGPVERTTVAWKFEPRVAPRVRDLVTSLAPDDRARLEEALGALCASPYIDNLTKFSVPYPPVVLCLYEDDTFRIVYRIANGVVVDLLNLDGAPDVPAVPEWDSWYQSKAT